MNRHVHLWFFIGVLIGAGTFAALVVCFELASSFGTEGKVAIFASLEAVVLGIAIQSARSWAKHKAKLHLRVSRELACTEARRLRLRQRMVRVGI